MNKCPSKLRKIHHTKCRICNKKMSGVVMKIYCSNKCRQRNKYYTLRGQVLALKEKPGSQLSSNEKRLLDYIQNNDITKITYVDINLDTHLNVNDIIKAFSALKVKTSRID